MPVSRLPHLNRERCSEAGDSQIRVIGPNASFANGVLDSGNACRCRSARFWTGLVEEAVCCEPVSTPNSLLNRDFTGNLSLLGLSKRELARKLLTILRGYTQFPKIRTREFNHACRDFLVRDQGMQRIRSASRIPTTRHQPTIDGTRGFGGTEKFIHALRAESDERRHLSKGCQDLAFQLRQWIDGEASSPLAHIQTGRGSSCHEPACRTSDRG